MSAPSPLKKGLTLLMKDAVSTPLAKATAALEVLALGVAIYANSSSEMAESVWPCSRVRLLLQCYMAYYIVCVVMSILLFSGKVHCTNPIYLGVSTIMAILTMVLLVYSIYFLFYHVLACFVLCGAKDEILLGMVIFCAIDNCILTPMITPSESLAREPCGGAIVQVDAYQKLPDMENAGEIVGVV
mmetsp:Transcript_4124/g.8267  ORF Transcript_4124/g.8267 Transcript_4124/m.8267 type:complete len:186 (+) Transcript_4124:71-628(+)